MQKKEQAPIFSSRGNGKLMISGEYLVLKGSKALSVPLKIGQSFEVFETNNSNFSWEATHIEGNWNSVIFNDKLTIISCSDESFAKQLQKIIRTALKHSEHTIKYLLGKKIVTHLEFLPEWGLGSSSTLIYNLSEYLRVDPYQLLQETFKGSGYDIANASKRTPIFFLLIKGNPRSVQINFEPPFKENIYFIYRGNKQSSKSAIRGFHKKNVDKEDIERISAISTYLTVCNDITEFQELINEHEEIVGRIIGKNTVKQEHFSDFDGSIKSLGAWGGDFVMAVTSQPKEYVLNYFHSKDLKVIFDYDNLVLNNPCMEC